LVISPLPFIVALSLLGNLKLHFNHSIAQIFLYLQGVYLILWILVR